MPLAQTVQHRYRACQADLAFLLSVRGGAIIHC